MQILFFSMTIIILQSQYLHRFFQPDYNHVLKLMSSQHAYNHAKNNIFSFFKSGVQHSLFLIWLFISCVQKSLLFILLFLSSVQKSLYFMWCFISDLQGSLLFVRFFSIRQLRQSQQKKALYYFCFSALFALMSQGPGRTRQTTGKFIT